MRQYFDFSAILEFNVVKMYPGRRREISLSIAFKYLKILGSVVKCLAKSSWNGFRSSLHYARIRLLVFMADMGEETGILAFKLMVNRNLHVAER